MINDYPNSPPGQQPGQQKLVLPGYSEDYNQQSAYTQSAFVHPDQLRPQVAATSNNPLSKLGAAWRADPAYKVLIVAATMVLVAGIIFTTFLVNTFAQTTTTTPKAATRINTATHIPTPHTTTTTNSGTNTPPTFPTPSGGQGSKQGSSQPPVSAPVVLPTLTPPNGNPQPTQPPQNPNQHLQLQITGIPQQVRNGATVQVTVMATQPDVSVRLKITFDDSMVPNTAGPQQTDANGNVTLNWHVFAVPLMPLKQNFVARITAFATDQNGQQVSSQTVSVDVKNNSVHF